MCAKLLQSCLTLCNPVDCSPLGLSVHGILQARIMEWAAMHSSRGSSQPRDWTYVSCIGRWVLYHFGQCKFWLQKWGRLLFTEVNSVLQFNSVQSLSRVWLFATLWTVAHLAPLSTGFSRQEYWSGLPFPSPGDLPDPGIELRSPALQADALTSEPPGNNFSYFTDDLHLSQWHSSLR